MCPFSILPLTVLQLVEVFKNLMSSTDAMLFCFELKKPVTHKTSHCAKFRLQAAAKL
jgi:hypothetical protein